MPRQHTLEEGLGSGPAHRVLAEVGNFDDAHGFTHGLHFRCHVVVAAVATERGRLVRIGGIDLVLTARRRPFHNIADFTKLGLDPRTAKIVAGFHATTGTTGTTGTDKAATAAGATVHAGFS